MAKRYATDDEILALAPELAGVAEALRDAWREYAECLVGLSFWGAKASRAHALYTAHYITVAPDGGPDGAGGVFAGPITAEANGPASRSYAAPAVGTTPGDAELAGSVYGLALIKLRRTVRPRSGIAVMRRGFSAGLIGKS